MDAVILCGGQGTRVRHLLPEGWPKIMAGVNGTPFVDILIRHLWGRGFKRLILAGGYGYAILDDHLTEKYVGNGGENIMLYIDKPRGTAKAVEDVKGGINSDPFWIFNGDTYCDLDYGEMLAYHEAAKSIITVACDPEFKTVGTYVASRRFVDLIPETDGKVDLEEVFTLLVQPVGRFVTDAPFYDIGDEKGLSTFRSYWASRKSRECAGTSG